MQDADQEPNRSAGDQLPANMSAPVTALAAVRSGGALSLDVRDAESGQGDDGLDLLSYWRILLKRKWTVLATLGIVFFTVLVATLLTTPIYRATTTMQIDLEPTKVVEVGATTGADPMVFDYYQTQYELLKSHTLAKRVAQQLVAEGVQYQKAGSTSPWKKLAQLFRARPVIKPASGSTAKADTEGMTGVVAGGLNIEPVRDSRLVRINFDSASAQFAAQAANAVADGFIASNIERGFDASSYAKKYLEDHLQQLRVKLEDSEKQLVQVAQQEKIFGSTKDGQSLSDQSLNQLNAALSVAQDARIRAEARWRQAAASSGQR